MPDTTDYIDGVEFCGRSSVSCAVSHAATPPAISATWVKPFCCRRLAPIDDR